MPENDDSFITAMGLNVVARLLGAFVVNHEDERNLSLYRPDNLEYLIFDAKAWNNHGQACISQRGPPLIRGEVPYYVTTLAIVLFGFQKLLNPSDPQLSTMPDVPITVPRGKAAPINVWLASHGPDCKSTNGWKIVATAKHGTAKIDSVSGVIASSVHENCNGRPIEGARLEYRDSSWFRSSDEVTVEMRAADAVVWRVKYIVTIAKFY
ncbi:hypothetical protein QA645_16975 [Bradyrhizobium sp. CIAT3101]|uniref:hypothetical protein n=1 Tax=Bradyrhizobium sp. CIAT3101 TaxID=439387 RepID=UPI0024B211A2|nr:hypothetical protein [Bradyrhizobium sp. CIAT3101]WFU85714.1 hypothetical protein QA645_16975 [Bradyrhizobium sp. CIAT3101]